MGLGYRPVPETQQLVAQRLHLNNTRPGQAQSLPSKGRHGIFGHHRRRGRGPARRRRTRQTVARLERRPVVQWSADALAAAGARELAVVAGPGELERAASLLAHLPQVRVVEGGAERIDSVRAGPARSRPPPARGRPDPRRRAAVRHRRPMWRACSTHWRPTMARCLRSRSATRLSAATRAGVVVGGAEREGLWRAQTPQAFRAEVLEAAYAAWPADETPTDDSSVVERAGGRVRLIPGDPRLLKLTYAEDFPLAESLAGAARIVRVGQGVDAHRFTAGDGVLALRRPDRARSGAARPLRRRRRPARPDRRHPGGHGRWRYRRPLPPDRSQVEGCGPPTSS